MQVLLDMYNDNNVDICWFLEAQLFSDWQEEPRGCITQRTVESTKKWCKLGDPQEVKLKDTKPQERGTNEVIFCGFHRYENNAMLDMYLQLEVFLWHSK